MGTWIFDVEADKQPLHPPAPKTFIQLSVILNITNPCAGLTMAFRCANVMRGGKKPFVVSETSKIAEGSGLLELLGLIFTPCAHASIPQAIIQKNRMVCFILDI